MLVKGRLSTVAKKTVQTQVPTTPSNEGSETTSQPEHAEGAPKVLYILAIIGAVIVFIVVAVASIRIYQMRPFSICQKDGEERDTDSNRDTRDPETTAMNPVCQPQTPDDTVQVAI